MQKILETMQKRGIHCFYPLKRLEMDVLNTWILMETGKKNAYL